ncbi:nucleotidyltransferase family protein [Wenyingzhuangia sp. 2_MG-2023]|uniref:nucleotidyltransferase family protein n=1 Tax=Wenyingzhuangia sp. 2_MG-2023 TaxID=3062639 RepID=UPI0026E1323A|nr:nucleotidyltransferase domain-containing protein [Wenyingzhuangia sp. 2_MG-2023]MDO6739434.1 nucleotidyltransferase domain-containing protein [Wenyingzhuangia sp. 2_MG-2023]MDO6803688.1 nucleotidyltransferase domain-containing protein [Wenyingzhuangia sp. 1_MG-2023]
MIQKLLSNKINELRNICSLLKVKKLYAFGSVVSNQFKPESDIDFLITFDEDISVEQYTENYFSLHYKLKEIFNRKIDLVTEKSLKNPYFIESINESKELIYEA